MPKKLLIPIDFKVESLITLKYALNEINEEVEVVLLYAEYLSDSITELLFYSPNEKRKSLMTPEFNEALSIIKNRFENTLIKLNIAFFHGDNVSAFRNFVEGNKIDSIYIPKNYKLKLFKNGFDPIPLIQKSKLGYQEVEWQKLSDSGSNDLSYLFY